MVNTDRSRILQVAKLPSKGDHIVINYNNHRFCILEKAGPKGCVGYRVGHLGRKDDLKNINQDTLFKAAAELDKTFDKHTKRYVKSLLECVELMDKKDATAYLAKRKTAINRNLFKV